MTTHERRNTVGVESHRPHLELAKIRQSRGLSQPQLAVAASVGVSSVQRLEAGDPRVGFGVASKVAAALDVPVESFYDGDDLPAHLIPSSTQPPEWARVQHDEIMAALREIAAALRIG